MDKPDLVGLTKAEIEEERQLAKRERIRRLRAELIEPDLDVDEVAEILELERSTVLRYLREHTIVGYQTGRTWRVPETELRAYKEGLLERERQEQQRRRLREELDRQVNLWARTQPEKRWKKAECPGCGEQMLTYEGQDVDGSHGRLFPIRRGTCGICNFDVHVPDDGLTVAERREMWRREDTLARERELRTTVSALQRLEPDVGWALGRCPYTGVLMKVQDEKNPDPYGPPTTGYKFGWCPDCRTVDQDEGEEFNDMHVFTWEEAGIWTLPGLAADQ